MRLYAFSLSNQNIKKIKVPHILSDSPRVIFSNIVCHIFGYPDKYFNNCYSSEELKNKLSWSEYNARM